MFAIYQLANAGTAARQRRRDDRTADLIGCDGFHRGPNWLLIIATALAVVICANAMLGGTNPVRTARGTGPRTATTRVLRTARAD